MEYPISIVYWIHHSRQLTHPSIQHTQLLQNRWRSPDWWVYIIVLFLLCCICQAHQPRFTCFCLHFVITCQFNIGNYVKQIRLTCSFNITTFNGITMIFWKHLMIVFVMHTNPESFLVFFTKIKVNAFLSEYMSINALVTM